MRNAIIDIVSRDPETIWSDLMPIDGFAGNGIMYGGSPESKIYLWDSLSDAALRTMTELLNENIIELKPFKREPYWRTRYWQTPGKRGGPVIVRRVMCMPMADVHATSYRRPHWLPTKIVLVK